ncbi:hypothetical protein [Actinomadura rupiterrae]|uniref:hypothetical protein n=1 Tax=Actinomadura rupiterrae TaxID=559627 RepID=UPI0020A2FC9E|nr:hypothetical protein [Actinomadura rupiterrae]MCP2340649.1 membrane protein implicated in regulation of membrane protease activity [Actinomadura rupiterrae]
MYALIWRLLPGGWQTKTAIAAGLVLLAAVILWYLVFPWAEPKIQFDHGVMNGNPATTTPAPTPPGP